MLWTVRLGVLLVMAMPLIFSPDTLFPYIVGKAIYARSVIEVTFGVWLLLILFYPRYRPSRSLVIAALGLWLLISLVSGLTGVSTVRSLWSTYERMQGIVDLAHWFVFIAITGSVFRSLADWRLLFTVNLIVCMIVSFLGINQHYGIFTLSFIGSADRIESTLGNATYVGAYTMVNALIALSLMVHSLARNSQTQAEAEQAPRSRTARRQRRRRDQQAGPTRVTLNYLPWFQSVWVLSIMLNLWALWLTGTRGAVVGLGAAMIVFSVGYAIWGRARIARAVSFALIAVSIAGIALFGVVRATPILDPVVESNTMLARISSIGLGDASISGRVAGTRAGLLAFAEKPVLGWGPENFLIAWGKHVRRRGRRTRPVRPGAQQARRGIDYQGDRRVRQLYARVGGYGLGYVHFHQEEARQRPTGCLNNCRRHAGLLRTEPVPVRHASYTHAVLDSGRVRGCAGIMGQRAGQQEKPILGSEGFGRQVEAWNPYRQRFAQRGGPRF